MAFGVFPICTPANFITCLTFVVAKMSELQPRIGNAATNIISGAITFE